MSQGSLEFWWLYTYDGIKFYRLNGHRAKKKSNAFASFSFISLDNCITKTVVKTIAVFFLTLCESNHNVLFITTHLALNTFLWCLISNHEIFLTGTLIRYKSHFGSHHHLNSSFHYFLKTLLHLGRINVLKQQRRSPLEVPFFCLCLFNPIIMLESKHKLICCQVLVKVRNTAYISYA